MIPTRGEPEGAWVGITDPRRRDPRAGNRLAGARLPGHVSGSVGRLRARSRGDARAHGRGSRAAAPLFRRRHSGGACNESPQVSRRLQSLRRREAGTNEVIHEIPPEGTAADDGNPLRRWDSNGNGRIAGKEARRPGIAPVRRGRPPGLSDHARQGRGQRGLRENQDATQDLGVREGMTSTPGSRDQADLTCGERKRSFLAALENEQARLERDRGVRVRGARG